MTLPDKNKINVMPPQLAMKIAAGEVIERPASIVKELVENSIDAAASEIYVYVEKGGLGLIKVVDNGEGMSGSDAALAFERHATSKIKDDRDISTISTMGFRGEALPSIASISEVTIKTRLKYDVAGTVVKVRGGKLLAANDCGCAQGTSVEVLDIFFNTPARKKFLRSAMTEFNYIKGVIDQLALAHNEIRFKLINGRSVTIDAQSASLKDRVLEIIGRHEGYELIGIDLRQDDLCIDGYILSPDFSFATLKGVHVFVNKRWIRDKGINCSIMAAYRNLLMERRFPVAVVYLTLPPHEVDVNVHPAKSEVRFRSPGSVYDLVTRSVKGALGYSPLQKVPSAGFTYEVKEGRVGYLPTADIHAEQYPIRHNFNNTTATIKDPSLLELDVIGQLSGEFILCSRDKALYIIDQHGASERIAFERLKEAYKKRSTIRSQFLLIPEKIEASHIETGAIESSLDYLEKLGFIVEPFGGATYVIKAVPEILTNSSNVLQLVLDLTDELADIGISSRFEDCVDSMLKRIACHSVIRGTRSLAREETNALLLDMAQTDFSSNCPHGRPVIKIIKREEIEKFFKRR